MTGHYVASRSGPDGWEMVQAADAERDQSYFLFATTQEQLNFLRFPLGGLRKSETRRLATELALPVASKPDSQDICFAPSGNYAEVIRKLRPESAAPGEIVHADGRVLGSHDGVVNFTIGQRKGLGVAVGEPLFVLRIDAVARRVVVGPRELLRTDVPQIARRKLDWLRNLGSRRRNGPLFPCKSAFDAAAKASQVFARQWRRNRRAARERIWRGKRASLRFLRAWPGRIPHLGRRLYRGGRALSHGKRR